MQSTDDNTSSHGADQGRPAGLRPEVRSGNGHPAKQYHSASQAHDCGASGRTADGLAGAWQFNRSGDMLTVTEPDGTRHTVTMVDWGSAAGVALLNRMVEALSAPRVAA
jgi:hypothetical protein